LLFLSGLEDNLPAKSRHFVNKLTSIR